jgi:hypothetical protein
MELAYPARANLSAWMIATLPALTGHDLKPAIDGIGLQDVAAIQKHLYVSSRCAVAHAGSTPIVNPDDPLDARRLYSELPIVRALAIHVVEEHFGLESRSSEFRKHLYELRGWKEVLGPALTANVLAGIALQGGDEVDLPLINVRLRECRAYPPLEGMAPSRIGIENGMINLEYRTADGMTRLRFTLNLVEERLEFNHLEGLFGHDDGSVAAAKSLREIQRFIRDYLLNGELQIWNAETGALLSRRDAFIPINCFVDIDVCNANIAGAQREVEARLAALEV